MAVCKVRGCKEHYDCTQCKNKRPYATAFCGIVCEGGECMFEPKGE